MVLKSAPSLSQFSPKFCEQAPLDGLLQPMVPFPLIHDLWSILICTVLQFRSVSKHHAVIAWDPKKQQYKIKEAPFSLGVSKNILINSRGWVIGLREGRWEGGSWEGGQERSEIYLPSKEEKLCLTIFANSALCNDLDFETAINPKILLRHLLTIPGLVCDLS